MSLIGLAVLLVALASIAGGVGFTGVPEARSNGLRGEWLTVDEAARRTGLSAAIWRRYARRMVSEHLARKVTRNAGKVRSERLIHSSAEPRLTAERFETACRVDLTRTPAKYAAWAMDNWRWVARFRGLRGGGLTASEAYRRVIAEAKSEGRKLSRRSLEIYTASLLDSDGPGVAGLIPRYRAARANQPAERNG